MSEAIQSFRDLKTIPKRRAQVNGRLGRNYKDIIDFIHRHQPVQLFPITRFLRAKRRHLPKDEARFFSSTAKFAPRYLEKEGTERAISKTLLTEMRKMAERIGPEFRVASTGCGSGTQELFAATSFPKTRIDATDFAPGTLREAQRIKKECGDAQVNFSVGTLENPGLPQHSYDLVVTFNAIHWAGKSGLKQALEQQKKLLKERTTSRFVVGWIPHHNKKGSGLKRDQQPTPEQLKAHQIPREHMIRIANEVGLELESVKSYEYSFQGIPGQMPILIFKLKMN